MGSFEQVWQNRQVFGQSKPMCCYDTQGDLGCSIWMPDRSLYKIRQFAREKLRGAMLMVEILQAESREQHPAHPDPQQPWGELSHHKPKRTHHKMREAPNGGKVPILEDNTGKVRLGGE